MCGAAAVLPHSIAHITFSISPAVRAYYIIYPYEKSAESPLLSVHIFADLEEDSQSTILSLDVIKNILLLSDKIYDV